MCAIAASVVVPPVWPLCAVAKMPAPARSRKVVKRKQLNVRIVSRRESIEQHAVTDVDIEVLRPLA